MAEAKIPPSERIVSSLRQLAVETNDYDAAFAELLETIAPIESALGKLGLRVSAWHQIAGHEDRDGSYWSRSIGWANVDGQRWGISIRRAWGHEFAEQHDEETWFFKDAPHWMCIESAGKLPDLVDELIKRTRENTEKIKARAAQNRELAAAISSAQPDLFPAPVANAKGAKR